MRVIIGALVGGLLGVGLLSGCGSDEQTSVPPPGRLLNPSEPEQDYLVGFRRDGTAFAGYQDDELVRIGFRLCDLMLAGTSQQELSRQGAVADDAPWSGEQFVYIADQARRSSCPAE